MAKRKASAATAKAAGPKVLFKEVSLEQFGGSKAHPEMTDEKAKELLGWRVAAEEGEEELVKLKDLEGVPVVMDNNTRNRPLYISVAKDYAIEMLRKKWQMNGESMVIDKHGQIQSAQHRLTGLILANQMLKANPNRWQKYGWNGKVTIPAIVVTGIDASDEVIDTLDIGKSRNLGDVLHRRNEFPDTKGVDKFRKPKDLSHALRLVWLRCTNKKVADAPKFPHSEAIDFLNGHPELKESVNFVYAQNGERGDRKISKHISLGYAAGLHYLMRTAKTDPDDRENPNFDLADEADEFFILMGNYDALNKYHPIRVLCEDVLPNLEAGSGSARDEIIGSVIKAWNCFVEGKKKVKESQVKMDREFDEKRNKMVLTEHPRIGGLDTPYDESETNQKLIELRGWKKGDTGWCRDDTEVFLVEVQSVKKDGSLVVKAGDEDADDSWTVEISQEQIATSDELAEELDPIIFEADEELEDEEEMDGEEWEDDEEEEEWEDAE